MRSKSTAESTAAASDAVDCTTTPLPIPINQGTVILSGYGISIDVDGGIVVNPKDWATFEAS